MGGMDRVVLHLPVCEREARAHGLDRELCRIVCGVDLANDSRVRRLVGLFLETEQPVAVGVVGPFQNERDVGDLAADATAVELLGSRFFILEGGASAVADALRLIDAEEVAFFRCPADGLSGYAEQMRSRQIRWWQFGTMSLRGMLTRAPSLVDPVAFYSRSQASIEVLGSRKVIEGIVRILL